MNPQPQRRRDNTLSSLNAAIEAMNIAKEAFSMTPAKAAFSSASAVLTMIKVSFFRFAFVGRELTYTGFYGEQNRLRRARASLRRCV